MSTLREDVDRAIAEGKFDIAEVLLREIRAVEPDTPTTAAFLVARYERIKGELSLQPYRLAILRSFTVEPLVPMVRASAFAAGLDLAVHVGEFNSYVQEIVDAESALYRFKPDTVILSVESAVESSDGADQYRALIKAFRERSQANLVIHSLAPPPMPTAGVLDAQLHDGERATFERINQEIGAIAREHHGVYVLDYAGLVARHGALAWRDERKWLTVRMLFDARNMPHMAREWMRFLHPLSGKVAKAIAVDLDNTLWGGIVGEDGVDGIKLGGEYPGAAYLDLQRALLDLRARGILLTICSKNNLSDAMEVLEKHPEMLLRPEHFAAMRINWNDKASSLREIAQELNIGLDAIAFLDDNPAERRQVRRAAREVTVVELAEDPLLFARAIRDAPVFERLTVSQEDRQRGELYREQVERRKIETLATSREDYLRSLDQEVEIGCLSALTLARVAQLTQKTNQFNLTTRRYTEEQLSQMAKSPEWLIRWIRVRDRFGDNGLVGVAVLKLDGSSCEIDTFLLSCRVIARTVETAFLARLVDEAQGAGAKSVAAWFLPTKKNAPAADFLSSHGFLRADTAAEGTRWVLDLPQETVANPEWIRVL